MAATLWPQDLRQSLQHGKRGLYPKSTEYQKQCISLSNHAQASALRSGAARSPLRATETPPRPSQSLSSRSSSASSAATRAGSAWGSAKAPRHPQDARLAVALEVDPGDQAVAEEEGEDVVAVDALRRRHVDLDPVAEVEEALGPLARPDQGVEGGQQGPCRARPGAGPRALGREVGGLRASPRPGPGRGRRPRPARRRGPSTRRGGGGSSRRGRPRSPPPAAWRRSGSAAAAPRPAEGVGASRTGRGSTRSGRS